MLSEKLAGVAAPDTEAVTLNGPVLALAVNVTEATPAALVAAVMVAVEFEKTPLAPPAGAVNVTVAPVTGLPPAVTVATRGLA